MRFGSNSLRSVVDQWRESILARFPQRTSLDHQALWLEYFSTLPKATVIECFSAIEEALPISVGTFRPDDSLSALFAPVHTYNPIKWLMFRGLESEGVTDLRSQLANRQRQAGTYGDWVTIRTFGEFVASWCGKKPDVTM